MRSVRNRKSPGRRYASQGPQSAEERRRGPLPGRQWTRGVHVSGRRRGEFPSSILHVASHNPMTRRATFEWRQLAVPLKRGHSPSGHSGFDRCATAPDSHRTFPETQVGGPSPGLPPRHDSGGLREDEILSECAPTVGVGFDKIKSGSPSIRYWSLLRTRF